MSATDEITVDLPDEQQPEPSPDAVTAAPPRSETDRLDPIPDGPVTLSNGSKVNIQPLKLRQFLRFLRIISRGSASMLGNLRIGDPTDDEFAQQILMLVVFAVPEAENETVDFLQSMVDPADLLPGRDKAALEANAQKTMDLMDHLQNPDLDDLITIVQAVIQREASDLKALGKRLTGMFQMAQKMGAVPQILTS